LDDNDSEQFIQTGKNVSLYAAHNDDNFVYTLTLDGEDGFALNEVDGRYVLSAMNVGEATLAMHWTEIDKDGNQIASGEYTHKVTAVKGYSSLLFAENAESYGLGTLAIANKVYYGDSMLACSYHAKFRAYDSDGEIAQFGDDIDFTVSDPSLLSIEREDDGIYFVARATGEVTVTASWRYGDIFKVKPAMFTLNTVDGVEVNDEAQLRKAFKSKTAVVLKEDIYLGENLFELDRFGARVPKYSDSVMREKLLEYTDEIKTTYDWQYFKNIGQAQPTVRYCLDITADIFGNGHEINAQYITDMLDSTDKPYDFAVFKGPLDFVATNTEGIKLAAVKGQDNIVFLARTDGVVID
ncbi:MAG: hypothetical protein K2L88_04700, partial [Clostridiales bacterium]|nr:hypothetical protein [Clostridiales bacterium]